ncbi:hypothetical protein, partial [Nonomuraea deserti]|uniref:hypothetical protein n=1 Tax=Nonomuraea deserti TaxID=1848322 RepID=UPI001C6FE526
PLDHQLTKMLRQPSAAAAMILCGASALNAGCSTRPLTSLIGFADESFPNRLFPPQRAGVLARSEQV